MSSIVKIGIWQFLLIYLLLIIILIIMKKCKVKQSKLLLIGSLRMTVQLVLAGYILTAIFKHPHPIFTVLYVIVMCAFAIIRTFRKNRGLNRKFKLAIACSLSFSGVMIVTFFVGIVVGENIFNPQYKLIFFFLSTLLLIFYFLKRQ